MPPAEREGHGGGGVDGEDRVERVFSYGTLRDPAVHAGLFGGPVATEDDAVLGYVLGQVQISDPLVVALSGSNTHPGLLPTGDQHDQVAGGVLALTGEQLAAADVYESAAYARSLALLTSGAQAWVATGGSPQERTVESGTSAVGPQE